MMRNLSARVVLYPFLFSVFPILSVFGTNIGLVSLHELIRPVSRVLGIVLLLTVALIPLLPWKHRRGLFILILVVCYYLRLYLPNLGLWPDLFWGGGALALDLLAIACTASMLLFVFHHLRTTMLEYTKATVILNWTGSGLLLTILIQAAIGSHAAAKYTSTQISTVDAFVSAKSLPSTQPDIVHIILDAYGQQGILTEQFGFDNSYFIKAIQSLGFYVAHKSLSNYQWTNLSIGSMLDLDYFSHERGPPNHSFLAHKMSDSKLLNILNEVGYTTVALSTGFSSHNMYGADVFLKSADVPSDLEHKMFGGVPGGKEASDLQRKRVRFALDTLHSLELNDFQRPVYVFAHVLSPHAPYVFGKNGEPVVFPKKLSGISGAQFRKMYHDQAAYITAETLQIIRRLRGRYPNCAILLHGDHGPRSYIGHQGWPFERYKLNHMGTLVAAYLPGIDMNSVLYPEISLINLARVVSNSYLGTHLRLLDDISYLAPQDYNLKSPYGKLGKYLKIVVRSADGSTTPDLEGTHSQ